MPSIIEVDTIKNKTGTQNTVLSTDGSGNNTLNANTIKDGSATKTLATLSSSAVTLHSDVTVPASAGSSLVLIKSVDTTATSTTMVEFIHGTSGVVFDSTYATYKVILSNCVPSSANKQLRADIGTSSAWDTSYNGGLVMFYERASDDNSNSTYHTFGNTYMMNTGGIESTVSAGGVWGELNINEPGNSGICTTVNMNLTYADNNGYHYGGAGFSTTLTNEANDRFRFYWQDATTFSKGRITLYGVKHA